jgi:predicted anti-sigma-YlaC factor YlaD
MRVLTSLRCRTVRTWLAAAHDDELSVERQVALDAHLTSCARCRRVRDELVSLATLIRQGAAERRPDETAFARLAPEVMARKAMEPDTRWRLRVRNAIDDRQRLWMLGGTLTATIAGAIVVATVVGLSTPTHPGSMAGLLRASTVGSNANPLWLLAGVTLPRVEANTRAAAMLIKPLPPLAIRNLALTAVVTREGKLKSVEVIHDGTPDAALTRAVSRFASDVRFEPARARGAPVAVNVVWLLERTTVAPAPDLAAPAGSD